MVSSLCSFNSKSWLVSTRSCEIADVLALRIVKKIVPKSTKPCMKDSRIDILSAVDADGSGDSRATK